MITNTGNQHILEYGFVWLVNSIPTYESGEKIVFKKNISKGAIETVIKHALFTDSIYQVRAFVRSADFITYGETVSFRSLGSKEKGTILSISPKIGNLSDVISITGQYFPTKNLTVFVGEHNATDVLYVSSDSISFVMPNCVTEKTSSISLHYPDNKIISKEFFTLISPEIHDINPKFVTYGDEIVISGKNFMESPQTLSVLIDNEKVSAEVVDDNTIKLKIPNNFISKSRISIKMNNQIAQFGEIKLKPFEIYGFNPKIGLTGQTISISGNYFNPNLANNIIYIDGIKTFPKSLKNGILEVVIPSQDTVIYSNRSINVEVEIDGVKKAFGEYLIINDKWFRKKDSPVNLMNRKSFVVNNTAYVGFENTKELWAYNPENDSWKKMADFPGVARPYGSGFVYQDKIYFGTGQGKYISWDKYEYYDDWWEYNTTTNTWTKKNNFPYSTGLKEGFSTNDGCYLTEGYTTTWDESINSHTFYLRVKKYDPANDLWTTESIGSKVISYGSVHSFTSWLPVKMKPGTSEVYISTDIREWYKDFTTMYILNTKTKTMTQITDYPADFDNSFISYYLNDILYIKIKGSSFYTNSTLNFYDESTQKWKYSDFAIDGIMSSAVYSIFFDINDKGYLGSGLSGLPNQSDNNRMYEFDPNR